MNIRLLAMGGILLLFVSGISASFAWINPDQEPVKKAPTAVVGQNVYVVWFTDKEMPNSNGEVFFRASNDGGSTFGEKINLSSSSYSDSIDAEISADAETVVVTWWEARQNRTEPVMRVSTDSGVLFGPKLRLDTTGTIGTGEAKPVL